MEQTKIVTDLPKEENREAAEKAEVRTLSELELVLAGGGEGAVNW